MQTSASTPDTTASTQRRGKIARLPREIREQLNTRLDDGEDAAQILSWLNALPAVQKAMANHFNGQPISPQNLGAWRKGGFQEWLFQTDYLDSAFHMREHVQELQKEIDADTPGEFFRSMADFMVNHLAVRFTVFMGRWDGSPTADHQALMKTAMVILKLQAACLKSERAALEIPQLRWKARLEQEKRDELLAAYEEHKEEQAEEVLKEFMESYEAKMKKEEAKKAKKKHSKSDAQSSPIKATKGNYIQRHPKG
ncbi:MAG TPA: hypothetical protein VH595_08765 [Verrucomicrobiae bacterium]|nr:hypothetical protein [Verrucomicrobiae bacterium]